MSTVYVVPCVDTEGPVTDPVQRLLEGWGQVEAAVRRVCDPAWRQAYADSQGRPVAISWFILEWTGFLTNPVRRDFAAHAIYDRYRRFLAETPRDGLFWHYHHPSMDGVGNHWNTRWLYSPEWIEGYEYDNILARKILERGSFPNAFRAGGTIEDNDASAWLERWIPFDYSNRAPLAHAVFDWSRAPAEWSVYSPSREDYQRPGGMKRHIARCLDGVSSIYRLTLEDVDQAFREARARPQGAILAFFQHDYRDMAEPFGEVLDMVRQVAARYPDVAWRNAAADEAMRCYLGRAEKSDFRIELSLEGERVAATTNRLPFGPTPFLAVKRADGECRPLRGLRPAGPLRWRASLGRARDVVAVGAGACDTSGFPAVRVLELER